MSLGKQVSLTNKLTNQQPTTDRPTTDRPTDQPTNQLLVAAALQIAMGSITDPNDTQISIVPLSPLTGTWG
jgi:hypothetical protein